MANGSATKQRPEEIAYKIKAKNACSLNQEAQKCENNKKPKSDKKQSTSNLYARPCIVNVA